MTTLNPRSLPLCILLSHDMGGPHAWAVRLRKRLEAERKVLIAVHGRNTDLQPDFTYETDEELQDWLVRQSPAVVMPNWVWSAYEVCSGARAAGARLAVIAYCRSDKTETYYEPLRRYAAHWDWVVAVSTEIRDELERQGYNGNRIRLMHTFVDRPAVLQRDWQTTPLRILYSGRLEQLDKNVLCLPEVATSLLRRGIDFRLTVAGSGSSANELRRAMHTAGVASRVIFAGQLSPTAMPDIYLQHDALVMTSTVEGRSNALIEAMAHGCVPVIFQTPSGWRDVLPPDLHHLAVPQGDVVGMVNALEQFVRRPQDLSALAHRVYASTADSSWAAYRSRFGILLDEVSAPLLANSAPLQQTAD